MAWAVRSVVWLAISCWAGGGVWAAAPPTTATTTSNKQASTKGSKLTERSKQKSTAEGERAQLQQKLGALKREINRTEAAKDSALDTLAESEDAVSNANRSLRELSDEQNQTEQKIKQLAQEHKKLSKTVSEQQKQLGQLLRGQYVAGNEDRIKLLLSGDNPNRINRDLQYLGYLSQAQAKLLETLRANLLAVEKNQAESQNAKDEIEEIAEEERTQKAILETEKTRRSALLTQLSKKLVAQRKEAGNLERDDQRLGGLVDKLSKLIEEQKKADAEAAEKRRKQLAQEEAERQRLAQVERERLARIKAEKKRLASQANQAKSGKIAKARPQQLEPIDADQAPPKEVKQDLIKNELRNELTPLNIIQSGSFANLRGQLRLPVRGTLATKYGSKRGDGPNSKGLFIRASEGSEIKTVANGKVVFAEWLRGFGNLIIVDHGSQYLTIYGNNQTLFKRAGDVVKSGEIIANAGNSGGNEESGLYFEMRHQGRAFDPLGWVTIR